MPMIVSKFYFTVFPTVSGTQMATKIIARIINPAKKQKINHLPTGSSTIFRKMELITKFTSHPQVAIRAEA